MAKLDKIDGRWVNLEKPGGQVFFVGGGTVAVNGVGASDTYKGTRPEEPMSTIQAALDKTVAGRGDTVVMLPGTITITAALTMTKADVTLTGYTVTGPNTRNPSIIACATNSVEMIAVDAANVTIENLTLDHNTTTANIDLIDVGDATASTDFVLRNLFLDMEGSATNTDGINISADTASTNGLIEGVRIHDYDQDGIVVGAGNDELLIRNCWLYDGVSNEGQYGISNAGDGVLIDNCRIQTDGTAGVYQNGTAGNLCDYTTDNTSPSADANISGVFAATPGAAGFDDVTVGGS